MGSYTELTVAGYPVHTSKSTVMPEIMTVFRETDRRVFERYISKRNPLVWGEHEKDDEDELETAFEYSCKTAHVIDRLNVMGFTMERVRLDFELGRQAELAKFESWAESDPDGQWFVEEWALVKGLTFDSYATAFRTVIADSLRPVPFDDHKRAGLDPVVKYILGENDDYIFGFFGTDPRLLLRLACELVPGDSLVVQDITEVVHAGYYEETAPVCEDASQALVASYPENSSRIVLTEGSTDARVLREALALLYPHLVGYYSFLEFDSARAPGGAGYLASLVKAFSGAGITNRIVALFDNDTAAREATRALGGIRLPPNIVVRHYPNTELLRDYPTLGPSGSAAMDVNGLAASIELYLGPDVLRDDQGQLTPVQWKGYSEGVKSYQGEVLRKSDILAAFELKLAKCKANPIAFKRSDWEGLDRILQVIFTAFD